jgi:hypothetical protein
VPTRVVILLLLLLAREDDRQISTRSRHIGGRFTVVSSRLTGNAAIGQSPAGRGSIGIGLRGSVGQDDLYQLEALEGTIIVIGIIIVVLVAPHIRLAADRGARARGVIARKRRSLDARLQVIGIAPR